MAKQYEYLTQDDVDHFMKNGYIVIKNAFTKEKAEQWTENIWVRLGMDLNDKSTWKNKIHMPHHRKEDVKTFSPKAWAAMKDLLGGEERIQEGSGTWNDGFIVNLGAPEWEGDDVYIAPQDLDNWHVDGDFFVHFLDSPEQALLVIPVFSEIKPRGGGTYIAPDGIPMIAKYLSEHPEGVLPTGLSFTPSTSTYEENEKDPGYWSHLKEIKNVKNFVEVTGEVGDLVLMHPLMLHSASKNHTRIPRIITNPPVSLKEPFIFNRENPDEYSLVEKKTLKALGVDKLDYKITTERRRIIPKRLIEANRLFEEEKKRLAELEASKAKTTSSIAPASKTVAVA